MGLYVEIPVPAKHLPPDEGGVYIQHNHLFVVPGPDAKLIIQEGRVAVNGEPCAMRGKKLCPGDRAVIDGETELVVT